MRFGEVKVGDIFEYGNTTLIRIHDDLKSPSSCVVIEPIEARGQWRIFNNSECVVKSPSVAFKTIKSGNKFIYEGIEYMKTEYFAGWNSFSVTGTKYFSDEKRVERV